MYIDYLYSIGYFLYFAFVFSDSDEKCQIKMSNDQKYI